MQATQLYLDTARLGRMTPRAQQAHVDFVRLAGEEGSSLFFERFLQSGTQAWSTQAQARYPGLSLWHGVGALKASLRALAGSLPDLPMLLANRSAQLMKLAARLLYHPCKNVLVTDLGWPPYHELLAAEAARAGTVLTSVPVRDMALQGRVSEDNIVEAVRAHYLRHRCDGLFLTAVSHLGVRLPVERLVRSLESAAEPRFVVIDGSQDFCHVSSDLRHEYCDLYLAGCHKWLQAYHPMGLAFYGRRRSRFVIETVLDHLLRQGELDDPLLRFSTQLETDRLDGRTETVSESGLPVFLPGGGRRCLARGRRPFVLSPPAAGQPHGGHRRGGGVRLAAAAAAPGFPHGHPDPPGRAGKPERVAGQQPAVRFLGMRRGPDRLRRRSRPAVDAGRGLASRRD